MHHTVIDQDQRSDHNQFNVLDCLAKYISKSRMFWTGKKQWRAPSTESINMYSVHTLAYLIKFAIKLLALFLTDNVLLLDLYWQVNIRSTYRSNK